MFLALLSPSHLPRRFCSCFPGPSNSTHKPWVPLLWFCFWVGQNLFPLCSEGEKKVKRGNVRLNRWVSEADVLERISALLIEGEKEGFFPMELSRNCSYCASLLIKIHCTSWNGRLEWNYYLSEHICCANPSRASNQSRLSSQYCWGKSLGKMCISLFSFGPITMTDDNRTRGKDFTRA